MTDLGTVIQAAPAIATAIGNAKAVIDFVGGFQALTGSGIISARFGWDGEFIQGNGRIKVLKHPTAGNPAVWWFSVEEVEDYTFVRVPVIESCAHELVGQVQGEANPDARYWRWVAQERQGVIVGGQGDPPNLKVDFLVFGYRPSALIDHFSPSK